MSYNPDPDIGVLNAFLRLVHLDDVDVDLGWFSLHLGDWLSDLGHLSLGPITINFTNFALVLPAFWAFTGFGVITFTAGLTGMSTDLLESAKMDGAGPWQTVRHVILPSLKGPMIVVLVQMVIFALRTFDIVYVMTGGGPSEDTMVSPSCCQAQGLHVPGHPAGGSGGRHRRPAFPDHDRGCLSVPAARHPSGVAMTGIRVTRRATLLLYGAATALALVWLVPMLGAFMISVIPLSQRRKGWWQAGLSDLTFGNYVRAWEEGLSSYVVNSFIITIGAVALSIIIGSAAAYAFSRLGSAKETATSCSSPR